MVSNIVTLRTKIRRFLAGIRTREWLVLVIGVALSLTVYQLMLAALNDRIDDQFQQDADTINSYMQQRLDTSLNMVIGLQAFSSVNSPVTHEAFHKYVASLKLDTYFPGINNFNYAERISLEKVPALFQRLAKEYPDAKLVESAEASKRNKNSPSAIAPKKRSGDALILSIIEPDDISTLAIGKNLFSIPAVTEAIYASIRANKPTSSGRLIQAESKGKSYIGIPIRLPVYQNGMPTDTEEQREAACIGSVGAGINIDSFLVAGNKEGLGYIKYQIFDDALLNPADSPASTLKNLIFDNTYSRANVNAAWPPAIKIRRAAFMTTRTLQISGDKSYRVVFTANGPAVADISLQYPLFAAGSILLIMLLVFILLRSSTIATQNAERARILADQANIAKGRFLANMSHEIRTPMNAVLGMLSLLMDSNLDNKQSKFASLAYDSAENLMVIINDILDFSKIEAGKLHLEQISFDLTSLIESVVESQEQAAIEKGIKLESHYLSAPTGPLVGDPTRIRQILINLANNAIKFTAKGRVILEIEAQNGMQDNCLLSISVTDTGIGLAPEKIHEIFDEFTQADESTTREYGGTGLGLSICKSLIGMMGGKISVVSELGRGSSFSFTLNLPYSAKSLSPKDIPTAAEVNKTYVNFKGVRVLVAEDNKANQIVITHMLKALGCTVDVASDGQQAVDMHAANHYDLILMDCQMPTMDGFDATSRIRAAKDEAIKTPIIALTAHTLPENKEKCLQAGMDDFISKPVVPATLHNVLMQWLKNNSGASYRTVIENEIDYKSNHFIEVRNMIGSAAFDEAATVFINEFAPQKLAALRNAINTNNLSEVSSISHVITGSASILGANLLSELCRDVEQQTKKHESLKNADTKMKAIEVEYRLVEAQIRTIIANDQSI